MLDLSSILEAIRRIRPDMLQGILGQGGGGPSAGMGIPGYSPGMFGPPYDVTTLPAEMPPKGLPGGLPGEWDGGMPMGRGFPGGPPLDRDTAMPGKRGSTLSRKPARMPGKDFAGAMPPRSSASSGIGPGATTQAQSPEQQAYFRRLQKLGISDPTKGARLAQNRPNSVLGRMYSKANPARRGS